MKTLTASACIVLIATISAPGIAASKHEGHGTMARLEQMKTGDKIRFLADNVNGAITVVKFEPTK